MQKFLISESHKEKRANKKHFVLRDDIIATYLQREMTPKDYFDLSFQYPEEADKILIDCMPGGGDWYSVYESSFLPRYRTPYFSRFYQSGIDLYSEWINHVHSENKECWLTHRVGDVHLNTHANPIYAMSEHPEWFLDMPGGNYKINNISIPEIQNQKLKVFAEVMRKYPFDGLDIDFERHTPILPPGKQWEMREHVTNFMRKIRAELLKIEEEQGRVIMLSARVPDCLSGCHIDGLDIEQWIKEDLIDCLTLGSRSFDIKIEEFRALSNEIQIYACYDPHHTVDGYLFPTLETLRAIWYSHLTRGADGIEYFNWSGEGKPELIDKYVKLYGTDPARDNFVQYAKDDFTGITSKDYLKNCNKTYVIDRKGGYPWGIGYGNLNADRQLPCKIEREGWVNIFVAEDVSCATSVTLNILIEEISEIPEVYFNERKLTPRSYPHRDLQVTCEEEAPVSGYDVSTRLARKIDLSKPCTMLSSDITGMNSHIGYNTVRIVTSNSVRIEKVELEVIKN